MRTGSGIVRRPPSTCWKALVDPSSFVGWFPNLSKARVIEAYPTGLPKQVLFELRSSKSYSLIYTYDVAAHEMRWRPVRGEHAAGFAKIEPFERGSRLTYGLEASPGGSEEQGALEDPETVVKEFVTWMHAY